MTIDEFRELHRMLKIGTIISPESVARVFAFTEELAAEVERNSLDFDIEESTSREHAFDSADLNFFP